MESVKARFVLHSSAHIIALGKADQEFVEYEVTVSERFPRHADLLPSEAARSKLFFADRAELIFSDGQVEIVKGGKKRR
jgi:hypothetical protein